MYMGYCLLLVNWAWAIYRFPNPHISTPKTHKHSQLQSISCPSSGSSSISFECVFFKFWVIKPSYAPQTNKQRNTSDIWYNSIPKRIILVPGSPFTLPSSWYSSIKLLSQLYLCLCSSLCLNPLFLLFLEFTLILQQIAQILISSKITPRYAPP